MTISFPQNGFFIRMDELPELKRDDSAREISARVSLPAGGSIGLRLSCWLRAVRSATSFASHRGPRSSGQ